MRQRVLDVLRAAGTPPTAQQLASALALHVTTVRFHLDQLEQAGLVARHTEHVARRGRPAVHYRAARLEAPQAVEQMVDALADALAAGAASRDDVLASGRRWADRLATEAGWSGDSIAEVFARLGFEPEQGGATLRLHACPFRAAARHNPEVVCLVHLGLAQGLGARAGGARIELRPFVEPELCLVTVVQDEPLAS